SKSLTVGHGAGVSPHLLRPLTKSLRNQLARSPRDPAPDVPPRLIQRRLHQKERIPMRPPLPETTDTAVPPHQPLRAGQVVPAQPLPPHPLQPGRSHPRNQHRPPRAALPRLQTPRRRRQIPQRPRKPQQLRRLLRRQIQPPRHPHPQTPAPSPCRHLPPIHLGHQHRLPSHRMTPHLLPEQQLLFDLIRGQVPDASFPHIHISNLQSSCDRKRPPAIAGGRPVSLYVAGDQRLSSKVSSKDRATRRRSPWPAPPPPPWPRSRPRSRSPPRPRSRLRPPRRSPRSPRSPRSRPSPPRPPSPPPLPPGSGSVAPGRASTRSRLSLPRSMPPTRTFTLSPRSR